VYPIKDQLDRMIHGDPFSAAEVGFWQQSVLLDRPRDTYSDDRFKKLAEGVQQGN
jgi:hypothetical protein